MHEVLVNRLGGLSLRRKNVVRLIDRPDMTLDVDSRFKRAIQQQNKVSCMMMHYTISNPVWGLFHVLFSGTT